MHSDSPRGNVQRMRKTVSRRGEWAAARALVNDERFPTLLECTLEKHAPIHDKPSSTSGVRGRAAWKNCTERPDAAQAMIRVLREQYAYDDMYAGIGAPTCQGGD